MVAEAAMRSLNRSLGNQNRGRKMHNSTRVGAAKSGLERLRDSVFVVVLSSSLLVFAASAHATLPIQHWQTASGARVYFVENHDLPILDASVDFSAGSSRDVPAKAGLAAMTAGMLDLGAGGFSDDDISKRMADVGAALGTRFDLDRAGVSLRTLSSKAERDQALGVMSKVLQQPEFPEAVLAREKARTVAALKEAETQPEAIADKAFYAALYGTHPYGLPPSGEVATVSALTRQDLVDFYAAHYGANGAVIALMGDVTRAEAAAIAEQLSAQLPKSASAVAALPAVQAPANAVVLNIPHPAKQSHVLMGYPGMKRIDPDYFSLYVGNYILGGGGFDSRLTQEVRDKRGLAYSAYSYFIPYAEQGPFEIGLQTKRDQANEALDVVRKTLKDFVAHGPTQKELTQAKNNLVGGFPLRIDSNKKIAEYLAVIGFYQLPLTYLDDFTKSVEKVTVASIRDAFSRRVQPERMVTVIVAGPEQGEAPLATK
jgi:zinc protease